MGDKKTLTESEVVELGRRLHGGDLSALEPLLNRRWPKSYKAFAHRQHTAKLSFGLMMSIIDAMLTKSRTVQPPPDLAAHVEEE